MSIIDKTPLCRAAILRGVGFLQDHPNLTAIFVKKSNGDGYEPIGGEAVLLDKAIGYPFEDAVGFILETSAPNMDRKVDKTRTPKGDEIYVMGPVKQPL